MRIYIVSKRFRSADHSHAEAWSAHLRWDHAVKEARRIAKHTYEGCVDPSSKYESEPKEIRSHYMNETVSHFYINDHSVSYGFSVRSLRLNLDDLHPLELLAECAE